MRTKLLSIQPGSLYENGGAGRVLRRLYEGHEDDVTTLYVKANEVPTTKGLIKEVPVPIFPFHKRWMRWHLRTLSTFVREKMLKKYNAQRMIRAASNIDHDVVHVINHGPFSAVLCDHSRSSKPLWVSFHDHFSTISSYEDAKRLWLLADRRFLISRELGLEYQKLFGDKNFELITDGVLPSELSLPKLKEGSPICIYFAGLLHIEYLPLFRVFADSLELLAKDGFKFKLILRGTQKASFLNARSFEVEYRQNFVTDEHIKAELDEADILYLPIKFDIADFYLYSLSTKMVGYLGASGSILYHGPEESAACRLLTTYQASENCTSYSAEELKHHILKLLDNKHAISSNAKALAKQQFDLLKLQKQFWNESD